MSDLLLGVQTADAPTISIAGVTPSAINTAGILGNSERGTDEVIRLTNANQIYTRLGRFRSQYNTHYILKGFFDNLQGEAGTLYYKRMIPSNAVAASVTIEDNDSGDSWTFEAGRKGKPDPGVWGNQLWVNVIASSRASGEVDGTFDGSGTPVTEFTLVSVTQFKVGDWVSITGNVVTTPEYYKIASIDETASSITVEGSGSTVDHSSDTAIAVAVVDFTVNVYLKDSDSGNVELIETWTNLSPDVDSTEHYIGTIINDTDLGSDYVYFTDEKVSIADEDDFPLVALDDFANAQQLTAGANGTALTPTQMAAALSAFDDYPIRYLTNAEAFSETIWNDGEQYCNVRKDCCWVGTPDWSEAQAYSSLETWANKRRKSRRVMALNNLMWYYVADPLSLAANPVKRVPNVGHMIGYSIWITTVRGIHKVPAGNLQVPVGIVSLANEFLTLRERTSLAEIGLNAQITRDGEFPVTSARTPSKLPEFRWINAVNMQIYFKKSFEQSFINLEQEPNKAGLLNRIRAGMTNFSLEFYKSSSNGGNEGGFAEGAFNQVVIITVDDTNNPRAEVSRGIVHADYWFEPPAPAEKILIRVGLIYGG